MPAHSPWITLNNGIAMPALGLGVLDRRDIAGTAPAVQTAIACGYRLIDTAASYGNEREVGEGIARSGVARADIFVTTKLWLTDYGDARTPRACAASLRRLGLDYVDLYLVHWPAPSDFAATIAAFRAAERLRADGLVRAIGVSNFGERHLAMLIEQTGVVPAVNQIELHPSFSQRALRTLDADLGIITQSWSPLGAAVRRTGGRGSTRDPLAHPTVLDLTRKHGRTPAQIVLRWHLDHGLAVIPKSFRPSRIAENIDVFDFTLTPAEIAAIDALETGTRSGPDPDTVHAATFAITIPDAPTGDS